MQTDLTSSSIRQSQGEIQKQTKRQTRRLLPFALGLLAAGLYLASPLFQAQSQAQESTPKVTSPEETLTLDSTVRKMLKQNGEFLSEKFQQKADEFGRISAISELLPSVNVRVGSGFIHRSYSLNSGDPRDEPDIEYNITVSQPLYSRRFYRVGERFADYKSGKYRLQASANNYILETVQAYLEVQTSAELLRYAEKNLEDIRRLFNRVKARARVDPGQRYLLNRAQTRLSLGEEDLSKVRQLEAARRSKLSRLIGQGFGQLEAVPKLEGLPENAEESLVRARRKNPDLLAAKAEVKSNVSATAGAWGALLPEISLDINYRKSINETGEIGDIEDLSIGIGGSYTFSSGLTPIFDAIAEQQRLRAARFLRSDAERRLEEEIKNVWVDISESRRIHAQALQFLKATEREKNAYRRQFSAGQRNLLDLLNIQNEFFAAQQREINARVSKEVARYSIFATMGDLVDRFGGI